MRGECSAALTSWKQLTRHLTGCQDFLPALGLCSEREEPFCREGSG